MLKLLGHAQQLPPTGTTTDRPARTAACAGHVSAAGLVDLEYPFGHLQKLRGAQEFRLEFAPSIIAVIVPWRDLFWLKSGVYVDDSRHFVPLFGPCRYQEGGANSLRTFRIVARDTPENNEAAQLTSSELEGAAKLPPLKLSPFHFATLIR